jgi:glycosyltransferase involved in cell wall biosynthesis
MTGEPEMDLTKLRIALIHYWYVRRRGGERVLDTLAEMLPNADLFVMVAEPRSMPPSTAEHRLTTSFLQRIPGAKKHYRKMLPLFPLALESFNLDNYDLVLSHEAGPAKGVLTRARTCHINYCHSPMRYVWEMYQDYKQQAPGGPLGRAFYALSSHYVRQWDFAAAARVDHFLASSSNAAARIRKYYGRDAMVIYPPVDTARFTPAPRRDDFYLVVSPLVAYKRIDLAVQACNHLKRRLIVIGTGEESHRLRSLAGPTVKFLGNQPDEVVRDHFSRCRAFLFPGEEDVGLTPIEAQASGAPVIAFHAGGAIETVNGAMIDEPFQEGSTGLFFVRQTADELARAIIVFEQYESSFDALDMTANAAKFSSEQFKLRMTAELQSRCEQFFERSHHTERATTVSTW